MYILSVHDPDEEENTGGAYSIIDDGGNETIFMFEESEDAERYSYQLELDGRHPKLKVVEEELIAAHQTQADLLKRNFPKDAAQLAKERGGSLSYVVDGVFVGDNYYNSLFGYANTPIKQTFTVVPQDGGGFKYVPINQKCNIK